MIMPVETFKSPINTDIRLYKVNSNYFVPCQDILASCGFTSRGSSSITCMMQVKNHFHLTYFNETRRPQVEKQSTFLRKEFCLTCAKKIAEDTAAKSVSAVKKIAENLRRVDPPKEEPKEEIQTLFASRVEDDKDAQIAALKAKLAKYEALLPKKEKPPQLIFAERMQKKLLKKNWKIGNLAKNAGINSGTLSHVHEGARALKLPDAVNVADAIQVSLDWLCGRDEFCKGKE